MNTSRKFWLIKVVIQKWCDPIVLQEVNHDRVVLPASRGKKFSVRVKFKVPKANAGVSKEI